MRDKLIELIKSYEDPCDNGECPFNDLLERPCSLCAIETIADHLIANGVTFATDNNDGGKRNIRPIDAYTLAEEIESLQITVGGKPAHWYDAKHTVLRMIAEQPDVTETNVGKWIPVSERLPEPEQTVKVLCERKPFKYRYVCCGFYVPEKWNTEKSDYTWDYECCDEYDEETDAYIVNSGWYEVIHNWDDYGCVGIGDTVTHWMPLPEPPKEGEI